VVHGALAGDDVTGIAVWRLFALWRARVSVGVWVPQRYSKLSLYTLDRWLLLSPLC